MRCHLCWNPFLEVAREALVWGASGDVHFSAVSGEEWQALERNEQGIGSTSMNAWQTVGVCSNSMQCLLQRFPILLQWALGSPQWGVATYYYVCSTRVHTER